MVQRHYRRRRTIKYYQQQSIKIIGTDSDDNYFAQASNDDLCGFHAALNARRYLVNTSPDNQIARMSDQELFDNVVESLARTPGVDIRVLKGNSNTGGIDEFQIRALLLDFLERNQLPCDVELSSNNLPFSVTYRDARQKGDRFAIVVGYRNGTHWVTVAQKSQDDCWLIDNGTVKIREVDARIAPQLGRTACLVTWQMPGSVRRRS